MLGTEVLDLRCLAAKVLKSTHLTRNKHLDLIKYFAIE